MKIANRYFAVSFGKMKQYEKMHGHKRSSISLIFGTVVEQLEGGTSRCVTGFNIIPSNCRHRVLTNGSTYALTLSGPIAGEMS
jgi:hypothetical protein